MRRVVTIALMVLHLFGNTEFNELLHIPRIFIHYFHHLQTNREESFVVFLSEHYGKGDQNLSDDIEERELPFRQVHHHSFTYAIIQTNEEISLEVNIPFQHSFPGLPQVTSFPRGYEGSPLKPPRYMS